MMWLECLIEHAASKGGIELLDAWWTTKKANAWWR